MYTQIIECNFGWFSNLIDFFQFSTSVCVCVCVYVCVLLFISDAKIHQQKHIKEFFQDAYILISVI